MAKNQWIILVLTAVLGFLSCALIIVSMATQYWITSEAALSGNTNSKINYGLWTGTLERNVLISSTYLDLNLVCMPGNNICMYSCKGSSEERDTEIATLLDGQMPTACLPASSRNSIKALVKLNQFQSSNNSIIKVDSSTSDKFFNYGLWLTTIIFLSFGLIFAFISAGFSLVNVIYSPVEPLLGIFGLYIWNGIAIGCGVMAMLLYGILFEINITSNISITDTIVPQLTYNSSGLASLGFSFWILLPTIFIHGGIIGLLLLRRNIINKEPPPPPEYNFAKNDATILLY